ncbi:ferredoxin-NAD reductase [Sesbania bispinosa]|nr:ferredoxin-NAD reductase [Sesbania bispinosa]
MGEKRKEYERQWKKFDLENALAMEAGATGLAPTKLLLATPMRKTERRWLEICDGRRTHCRCVGDKGLAGRGLETACRKSETVRLERDD